MSSTDSIIRLPSLPRSIVSCCNQDTIKVSRIASIRAKAHDDIKSISRVSEEQYQKLRRRRRNREVLLHKIFVELAEDKTEVWMKTHKLTKNSRFSVAQLRGFRYWFDTLDCDGSGEISVQEMAPPLVATGIVKSTADVAAIIRKVDKDGSGEIGFKEFLIAIRGDDSGEQSAFGKLYRAAGKGEMAMLVSSERRRLLLESIMGSAMESDKESSKIISKWEEAVAIGDKAAAMQVYQKLEKIIKRKKDDEYVKAVMQNTDFVRERKDIDVDNKSFKPKLYFNGPLSVSRRFALEKELERQHNNKRKSIISLANLQGSREVLNSRDNKEVPKSAPNLCS